MTAAGLLLLTAAGLKAYTGVTGPAETLAALPPWVQLAGTEAEVIVGLWLVIGRPVRWAWAAGAAMFVALGVVSTYLLAIGQSTCGCFGRVEVNPWVSLAVDSACLAALVVTRPAFAVKRPGGGWRSVGLGITLAAGVAAVGYAAATDAADRLISRLRGQSLRVIGDVDAGRAESGRSVTTVVTIENVTGTDVRLIGGTSSCACVTVTDLPATVPANGRVQLRVSVKFAGDRGDFRQTMLWYTDCLRQPTLVGTVSGRVGGG